MSTYFPKAGEIVRKWYVVDAEGQTLGRLASQVARILMGKKQSAVYAVSRHGRSRDRDQRREDQDDGHEGRTKVYQHYTGYPGGLRTEEFKKRAARRPEAIIEAAVKRMLPKNKLAAHIAFEVERVQGRQTSASGAEAATEEGAGNAEVDGAKAKELES